MHTNKHEFVLLTGQVTTEATFAMVRIAEVKVSRLFHCSVATLAAAKIFDCGKQIFLFEVRP